MKHTSATAPHYDKEADTYDLFNEPKSWVINQLIEQTLKQYNVKTVLDLACGTGLQLFWLSPKGFDLVGVDINAKMLAIAQQKAHQKKLDIKLLQGDMRTARVGTFDAVLTISNAIGHLTKEDFEKTLQNIRTNLKDGGLYVFDIFNLNYLLTGDNITSLTIDWMEKDGDAIFREIQYSTIDQDGVLTSYDIYHEQVGSQEPKISTAFQTLQVYTFQQLKDLLQKHEFKVLQICDVDGSEFVESEAERAFVVAEKV